MNGSGVDMTLGETRDFDVYGVTFGYETEEFSCNDADTTAELQSSDPRIAKVVGLTGHTKVYETTTDVFRVVAVSPGDVELRSSCGGAAGSVTIHVKAAR
jgi:hypothetical protein